VTFLAGATLVLWATFTTIGFVVWQIMSLIWDRVRRKEEK